MALIKYEICLLHLCQHCWMLIYFLVCDCSCFGSLALAHPLSLNEHSICVWVGMNLMMWSRRRIVYCGLPALSSGLPFIALWRNWMYHWQCPPVIINVFLLCLLSPSGLEGSFVYLFLVNSCLSYVVSLFSLEFSGWSGAKRPYNPPCFRMRFACF